MRTMEQIALVVAIFYIAPVITCYVFSLLHNKDNPLRKESDARQWVFMPVFNVTCMLAIIYYIVIEMTIRRLWRHVVALYKKVKRWNKE